MKNKLTVTGAREHNLKNINLELPKNKLVVFTGMSGSGKSSLAFDTLYAEGQRRYVESLSSYARQFLGVMHKPDVDQIEGLSPAISIDQKTTSHNPRSTVGTITEIYDYLRLLFARVGHPHCPNCGREISTQSIDQIVHQVMNMIEQEVSVAPTRVMILAPVIRDKKGEFSSLFDTLKRKGYSRVRIDGKIFDLSEDFTLIKTNRHTIEVLIDRLTISKVQLNNQQEKKSFLSRLNNSLEESLKLSEGYVVASIIKDQSLNFPDKPTEFEDQLFSEHLACSHCGISIEELEPRLFSFNSPHGACPTCNGLGSILKIDKDLIVAPEITLSQGAIIPFASILGSDTWWSRLVKQVVLDEGFDFEKTKFNDLSPELKEILLFGSDKVYEVTGENRFGKTTTIHREFEGFIKNLERRYQETDSDFIRKDIERYMQKQTCQTCHGQRLKEESLSVTIEGQNIAQITHLPIDKTLSWSKALKNKLSDKEQTIAESILKEVTSRLKFLESVGLTYLTLDREAATLAGGEAQRIRLASQIGTGLTGVLYILDEPTIGLHQRDNRRLIKTLHDLRDKGNTVIVVEHDREVIEAADYVADFGPKAGKLGGEVIAEGTPQEVEKNKKSVTGKYLSRKQDVEKMKSTATVNKDLRQVLGQSIQLSGATHHNLKSLDINFPLGKLTCITGISGSGKSTLLHDTLYLNLAKNIGKRIKQQPGNIERLMVPDVIKKVTLVDQSPIGKTPRSNPATYTKTFDYIRQIFANTKEAKIRGYKPGRFSFNVKGGRCETCKGDGQLKIEMQFLPDVYVTCDVCEGARYNQESLQVLFKGKTISEVLKMDISEAFNFFTHSTLKQKLQTLIDVGMGYIELGQPAPTLSGGEAQRVKLAKELSGRTREHVVYLLDEPTTGLHFADVQKLLDVLYKLVANNNTVILIEHNLDIIKNADWIIDLGPEGGAGGGELIAEGTPEQVANHPNSFTGKFLQEELAKTK